MLKICDNMKLDMESHEIGALLDGLRFLQLQQSTQEELELENSLGRVNNGITVTQTLGYSMHVNVYRGCHYLCSSLILR